MTTAAKLTWKFPRCFWVANTTELFERCAYYAMFIAITLYLTDRVGFTDIETGWIVACFAALTYFLPPFLGLMADRIGYRSSLIMAFLLLSAGYALLGAFQLKLSAILSLTLVMFGGALIKPVITGNTARCSDDLNRARAFSIFYQIVNIGAFTGKTIAKPLRTDLGLEYINYFAAGAAFVGLLVTLIFYRSPIIAGTKKTFKETVGAFKKVVTNMRFMTLIVIVAGFWIIQGQMYATMPKYTIRMIGPSASPEWLANVNPLVVVLCVIPITYLARRLKPISSIIISLSIIPISALLFSLSPVLQAKLGSSINVLGILMHPITIMMIIGIAFQGLGECFLSPRYYEFASKQAPKGEEGLYMGYAHLSTFLAWFVGFVISGYLLEAFCPDPKKVLPENIATVYAHAHYIWYVFAGIGLTALLLLIAFKVGTDYLDRKRARAANAFSTTYAPVSDTSGVGHQELATNETE